MAAHRLAVEYTVEDRGYETPCWIWQGCIDKQGYGVRFSRQAHRWFYERDVGPIPKGLVIDHLCRVHSCVNAGHMEPVTQAVNVRRGLMQKLTPEQIEAIRAADGPQRAIAQRFNISQAHVSNVKRGMTRSG